MTTNTPIIPDQELFPLLQSIKNKKLRIYATLLYYLAARAGELMPYQHYKTFYKKDEQGKLLRDENNRGIMLHKIMKNESPGVKVSTIEIMNNGIQFNSLPVFKAKEIKEKTGFVQKKDNPLYNDVLSYVLERKELQEKENKIAEHSDVPPKIIYLFDKDYPEETREQYFWRIRKRLYRIMYKQGYRIHSLRKTRLSQAGNISGDPFYVKSLSGHATINMADEYVQGKNLRDMMKKYEGI